jgi:hypothetical protein
MWGNHMKKVFLKGGNGNHSGRTFGGVSESCFLSKKVAKWYKRLKDC